MRTNNNHNILLAIIILLSISTMFFAFREHHLRDEVMLYRSQPALPYTEPHEIFLDSMGRKCAGWHFPTHELAFVICSNRPALLIDMSAKNELMSNL